MKRNKFSNRTIALIAAAVLLFAGGAFTGTQAVLNIFSPEHFLQFETDKQYVQIQENGKATASLLTDLGGNIVPGKEYTEKIRAKNITPDAPQFVRIVVRKYWGIKAADGSITKVSTFGNEVKDEEGNTSTVTTPDPAKIELGMSGSSKWQRNPKESTTEREVYYYTDIVPVDGVTDALTSTLTVNNSVALKPTISDPDPETGIITYTYDYDGYCVCLEAEAQSIQTHNVTGEHNAIRSIWGVDNVTSDGTTLKVN